MDKNITFSVVDGNDDCTHQVHIATPKGENDFTIHISPQDKAVANMLEHLTDPDQIKISPQQMLELGGLLMGLAATKGDLDYDSVLEVLDGFDLDYKVFRKVQEAM